MAADCQVLMSFLFFEFPSTSVVYFTYICMNVLLFTSSPPCHQCKKEVEWLCMSKMILGHITLT